MAALVNCYNYMFVDIGDDRVKEWFLMSGPELLLLILGMYTVGLKYAKADMEKRQGFDLKTTILLYNVFQIIANFVLVLEYLPSWLTEYSFRCELTDYSESPKARRMLNVVYWNLCLKLFDLIETYFFVLRKKFNQVSTLHVSHHIITCIMAWILCKYTGGGLPTFSLMINDFVHVLMYTYYLLSSLGPDWQKKLAKWKQWLTTVQIVQFFAVGFQNSLGLLDGCKFPSIVIHLINIYAVYLVYMFGSFYVQAYVQGKKRKENLKLH